MDPVTFDRVALGGSSNLSLQTKRTGILGEAAGAVPRD